MAHVGLKDERVYENAPKNNLVENGPITGSRHSADDPVRLREPGATEYGTARLDMLYRSRRTG
jgi:hypothetical protein